MGYLLNKIQQWWYCLIISSNILVKEAQLSMRNRCFNDYNELSLMLMLSLKGEFKKMTLLT